MKWLFFVLLSISFKSVSQTTNSSSENELSAFLISKYGLELTEKKLLQIKDYEERTSLNVLTDETYTLFVSKWNLRLTNELDEELRKQIIKRIQLFVPFSEVEPLIH